MDTDIGTDSDDAVALALAIKSPEIQVEGVTTVYGDVSMRSNIANRMIRLSDGGDIKVYRGIEKPLLWNREVTWPVIANEQLNQKENVSSKHAVDFIIETIMNHPGEITLVTIGALTNIAAAIIREPGIINRVKKIVMMGGVTRLGRNGIDLPIIEHNIKCDPEAASLVFSSGAPILMVGLDVTRQVMITRDEIDLLASSGTPLAKALTKQMEDYMDYRNRNFTFMHDPLAVAAWIDPTIVKSKRMNVHVAYDHCNPTGQTIAELNDEGNVDVCLEVDRDRFFRMLKLRVFSY
nr:nucleoside hydrolase [Bacillus sp. FJAT-50079]